MNSTRLLRRRNALLTSLAAKAKGRHDVTLPLSEVAPGLDIGSFAGGTRFIDSDDPRYEGGSDSAYDYTTLYEDGLIEPAYLDYKVGGYGERIPKTPGIRVTRAGLDVDSELRKHWLRRSIEKQPITFLSVVVTVLISALGAVGGWYIGSRTANSQECAQSAVTYNLPLRADTGH